MKYLGIGLVQAWRHTFGLLDAAEHVQVPPDVLSVRARRAAEARSVKGSAKAAGACSAATPGATAESIPRDRREHPHPLGDLLTWVLTHLHETVGLTWAWSIVASS